MAFLVRRVAVLSSERRIWSRVIPWRLQGAGEQSNLPLDRGGPSGVYYAPLIM